MTRAQIVQETTSKEVLQTYLERIIAYDGNLKSFITVFEKDVLQEAEKADDEISRRKVRSKFHGVPIAIKDVFAMKGTYTTAGSGVFRSNLTDYDTTAVERLK